MNDLLSSGSAEQPSAPLLWTWDALRILGFQEEPPSYGAPCLSFNFGNFKLRALDFEVGRHFQPMVWLIGHFNTGRAIGSLETDMYRETESVTQTMVWVTWSLDHNLGDVYRLGSGGKFVPRYPVWWLEQGRKHFHLLPWIREREAYERRPWCTVSREWFRTLRRELMKRLPQLEDDALVTFWFDGEILKLRYGEELMAVVGKGNGWLRAYSLPAASLRKLPTRLLRDTIVIDVWEGQLGIDRSRFDGVIESEVAGIRIGAEKQMLEEEERR